MKAKKTAGKDKPTLVWAVDPMESDTRPSLAQFKGVCRWANEMGWEIQPVTVVTPTQRDLARGLFGSVNHVQAAMDSYLSEFPKMKTGRVLVNEGSTQATAVGKILQYAHQNGAAAMAVSSHGRSGFDRLVMGSFAEKLLEDSPWPVFFLNQAPAGKPKGPEVVLFPTDFSDDSKATYHEFLKLAAGRKISLVLLHMVNYPLEMNMGIGSYVPDGFMEERILWATKEGGHWVHEAEKCGLKAELVVRETGIGSLNSAAILDAAGEFGATAIVMKTKSGAVGRFLLGSLAYPVFRANRFLTILYGPNARPRHRNAGPSVFASTAG